MTGQVKEDLLCRFGELGVRVAEGKLGFDRALLPEGEYLKTPAQFKYVDVAHKSRVIELPEQSLAYTICQVPVVYLRGDTPQIQVLLSDGTQETISGSTLNKTLSQAIFKRSHKVARVTVIG